MGVEGDGFRAIGRVRADGQVRNWSGRLAARPKWSVRTSSSCVWCGLGSANPGRQPEVLVGRLALAMASEVVEQAGQGGVCVLVRPHSVQGEDRCRSDDGNAA